MTVQCIGLRDKVGANTTFCKFANNCDEHIDKAKAIRCNNVNSTPTPKPELYKEIKVGFHFLQPGLLSMKMLSL